MRLVATEAAVDRDKLAPSRGALPKMTLDDQLTPPEAVVHNLDPKLPEPPSVMALSAVRLPQLGFGPYDQGNFFSPGKGGVTAPRSIYDPDPEYSDAARRAKYQGSVLLWLVVARPTDVHATFACSVRWGLDEKAIEAVSQWRFQPATLNAQPVAVQINVEVSFRL
jgi:protein TonB